MPLFNLLAPLVLAGSLAAPERVAIGLVGDSQFNTVNARKAMYRRGLIDRISTFNVAIRPPALDHTSHYLLRSIVAQLVTVDKVEMIVFLGDGANNGCSDELIGPPRTAMQATGGSGSRPGILTVLRELREQHKVPIYFVIGNHDILGAGNMAFKQAARRKLCNLENSRDNKALTKFEVMGHVHAFNTENQALAGASRWRYEDSWDEARLDRDCGGPRRQHKRRGCFLAAAVVDRSRKLELLLVDSTDFRDVHFLRTVFAGVRGAVSWRTERSQIGWFERWTKTAAGEGARGRVIFSHYNIRSFKPFLSTKAEHLGRLLRPGNRVWISAHTHKALHVVEAPLAAYSRRAAHDLQELNIGSTTDWPSYGVAATLVVAADGVATLAEKPQARYGASADRCQAVLGELERKIAPGRYSSLPRHTRGLGLFGLDIAVDWTFTKKEYRALSWKAEHDQVVRRNIDLYLATLPEVSRLHAGACIGMYAAILEGIKKSGPKFGETGCTEISGDSADCKKIDRSLYKESQAPEPEPDRPGGVAAE